jgi:hypothetical protein
MKKLIVISLTVLVSLVISDAVGLAQGASSNYRIDESFVGPGGLLESNSSNYRTAPGGQSLGNPGGVGDSRSTNFRAQAGATTTNDPSLTCSVGTSSLSFGSLSPAATATATATFSVLNYTSYGYIVQIVGAPPTNGSHTLEDLNANAASAIGTEQFGLNLVDNTTPNIGANPAQIPDSSFSFGAAATNYNTADSFRYNNGETIAQAGESSGQTNYTISYIINASTTTPSGTYSGSQTLVCIGTY